MEITNDALEWTSEDVIIWRSFLATITGSRLLPKLAEATPPLLQDGPDNSILIRSGKVLGFQEAVRSLLALTIIPPASPKEISAYPDLTDDAKWPEGPKITETNTP